MEELDLVFGDSDRPVTVEDLTELKYLECCIKESMRIYPPLSIIGRSVTGDVQAGNNHFYYIRPIYYSSFN